MSGLLIFHRCMWASCVVLCWLAVSAGLLFLLSHNPRTWRAMKFFGAGAITLAFLATWL